MRRLIALSAVFVLCASAGPARSEPLPQMLLLIEGVENDADARIVAAALARVPSVKILTHRRGGWLEVTAVALEGAKWDLGDLAKAVAAARSPAGPQARGTFVALKLKDGGAKVTGAFIDKVQAACAKLSGVDAKKCTVTKAKVALVKLSEQRGARWSEIQPALPEWEPAESLGR
jgi:hypothetical protein